MRIFAQLLAVVVLAIIAGGGWYLYGSSVTRNGGAAGPPGNDFGVAVQVSPAVVGRVAETVSSVGTVRAREAVNIVAEASGRIAAINFEENALVEEGDVLVELSTVREAAALSEAEAARDEAQRQLERATRLMDTGAITEARHDELSAALQQAQARVDAVRAEIEEKRIVAPFAGVLGLREVSRGAYLDAGTLITTLDDISVVRLEFSVPERFLDRLRGGLPVTARRSADDARNVQGEIARIDSRVDPVTRSIRVQAEFANEDAALRPGQFLTVVVDLETRPDAVLVPEEALVFDGDTIALFRVVEDENGDWMAERVKVRLGLRRDAMVEIVDGIKRGDWVVSAGIQTVRDGGKVRVLNETELAAAPAGGGQGDIGGGRAER